MKSPEMAVPKTSEQLEQAAEEELDRLLEDPENKFLTEIPTHNEFIFNVDSAVKALTYAKEKIKQRLERGTYFNPVNTLEGSRLEDVNVEALRNSVLTTLKNQLEIGRGGDAFVVIDKNEVRDLPPEICYKFALVEATPRGRNDPAEEAKIQGLFYNAVARQPGAKIGIPIPFYSLEIGPHRMIAMEKLPAKSIDDILRGKGRLPKNFNVDQFCEELEKTLDYLHENNLYHRDMHPGNIMITQKEFLEESDQLGYLIDFGLSSHSADGDMPYEKQVAGSRFTYSDDYGIISGIKSSLKEYQVRSKL